jgi:hypothetical protein
VTGSPKVEWLEAAGLREAGYWNAGGFDHVPTGCPQIVYLEAAGCSEQTRRHVSKDRDLSISIDPHLNLTCLYVRQHTGCRLIILSDNCRLVCAVACRFWIERQVKRPYVKHKLKSSPIYLENLLNYSYNKSQRDALLSQIYLIKHSTCFGQVHCPSSSGVSQHCIHSNTC